VDHEGQESSAWLLVRSDIRSCSMTPLRDIVDGHKFVCDQISVESFDGSSRCWCATVTECLHDCPCE
jgi:hypothetical protein